MKISDEAIAILINYPWPGNVRELKNLIERIVVLNDNGMIKPEDLSEKIRSGSKNTISSTIEVTDEGLSFNTAVTEYEKALILKALEKANWVKNRAAELLQIKRTTLVEKIKRYKLKKGL